MIALSLGLFFLFFWGCFNMGHLLSEKLNAQIPFSLLKALLGFYPLLVLQTLLSIFFWSSDNPFPTSIARLIVLAYIFFGLVKIRAPLAKNYASFLLNKEFYFILGFLTVVFLPALFLRGAFEPSWDSDFIIFWIERLKSLASHAYFARPDPSTSSLQNFAYFSIFYPFLSSHFFWELSSTQLVYSLRLELLFLLSLCLFDLSQSLRTHRALFILPLVAGFPLKWINGYQDTWLALAFLWALIFILKKQKSSFWISLLILCLSKNEGLILSALLIAYVFFFEKEIWSFRSAILFSGALFPLFSWKFFSHQQHFMDSQTQWPSDFSIFLERFAIFIKQLSRGLGRAYQSWILEGFICQFLLILQWKKLESTQKRLWFLVLLAFLAPFAGVFLTPFQDFSWHLSTTISRIGTAGLLGMIYLAFYQADKTDPLH